jgi:hypothetical protein
MTIRTQMSGPTPKDPDQRVRRNKTPGLLQLPAAGRTGALPVFPLGPDLHTLAKLRVAESKVEALEMRRAEGMKVSEASMTAAEEKVATLLLVVDGQSEREQVLWEKLWRTPQAVEWQALGWLEEVALYTRWMVLAASGDLDAGKEARQYADRLGLTPLAMARLRWTVAFDDAQQQSGPSTPAPSTGGGGTVTTMGSRRSRIAAG